MVDDGSTDESAAIAARHPCRLVRLERRRGASAARNAGAAAARGDILFFTDADCILGPQTLPRAAAALDAAGPRAVVGGTYETAPLRPGLLPARSRRSSSTTTKPAAPTTRTTWRRTPWRSAPRTSWRAAASTSTSCRSSRTWSSATACAAPATGCAWTRCLLVRHSFGFGLAGSLRNAARKVRYWARYSLRNRDLLADSGTASRGLKAAGAPGRALLGQPRGGRRPAAPRACCCRCRCSCSRRSPPTAGSCAPSTPPGGRCSRRRPPATSCCSTPWRSPSARRGACWTSRDGDAADALGGASVGDAVMRHSPLRHAGALLWKRRPAAPDLLRHAPLRRPLRLLLLARADGGRRRPSSRPPRSRGSRPSVGPLLWLSYSGGEPTLREDLPEITAHLRPALPARHRAALHQRPRPAAHRAPRPRGCSPRRPGARSSSSSRSTARRSSTTACAASPGRTRASWRASRCCGSWPRASRASRSGSTRCSARRTRRSTGEVFAEVSRLDGVNTHTLSLVRGTIPDPALGAVDPARYLAAAEALARGAARGSQPRYRFLGARLKAAQDVLQRRHHRRDAAAAGARHPLPRRAAQPRARRARRALPLRGLLAAAGQRARPRFRRAGHGALAARPARSSPRSPAASAGARTSAT